MNDFERLCRIMRHVDGLMKRLPDLGFITERDFSDEYAREVYFDAKKAVGALATLKVCTLKPLYDAYKRQENDRAVERLMDYWDGNNDEYDE